MGRHESVNIMGYIISGLQLLLVVISIQIVDGKEISGHILTDQDWHYLDNFCVHGNDGETVLFNFEVEYIMRYFTHVQKIAIYNEDQWTRLTNYNCSQKQGLLDMRHQINLTESNTTTECKRIDPKVPGVRRMVCEGSAKLTVGQEDKWYIAICNCNAPISGVDLWYTLSITYEGGGNADSCYNEVRNRLIAVAVTLGVLLVIIYIAIIVLYFTKWRKRNNNETQEEVSAKPIPTYNVYVEQRTSSPHPDTPPNTEGPSSSNYAYQPDSIVEQAVKDQEHQKDNSLQRDYAYHRDVNDIYISDNNSIPIRYPKHPSPSDYSGFGESTDSPEYSRKYKDNFRIPNRTAGEQQVQRQQLWYNPSFVSDMSDEPKYNTDNYQKYLWNKMRDSPQMSIGTENTYDEIENQHHAHVPHIHSQDRAARYYHAAKI